jgi:hypothetical protein
MKIRQISVFIENKFGRIYDVTNLLGRNNLNIRAMSLADTSDFGIIRFIVNDPAKAHRVLKENDFTVGLTDVIAIAIPDRPGGLAEVLSLFNDDHVNIEYMYAFVNNSGDDAVMIFRFDDTERAFDIMNKKGVQLLDEEKLFNI